MINILITPNDRYPMNPFATGQKINTRRDFLRTGTVGIGSMALASLNQARAASNGSYRVDHSAKAKQVIFLHMVGGPSQMDLFDPKPAAKPPNRVATITRKASLCSWRQNLFLECASEWTVIP